VTRDSPLTQGVARLVLAPTLLVAAAVLVKGYVDTGDGFAAGVIAALGISLQYVAFGVEETERRLPVRHVPLLAVAGLLLALAVAFVPVAFGEPPLRHWPPADAEVIHLGTLEILSAVAFDLGVFLLVLGSVVAAIRFVGALEGPRP
jgi:multisubunit Na+/H+ antiporter MnhB subunit